MTSRWSLEDANASVLVTTDLNGSPARRILVRDDLGGAARPSRPCGVRPRRPVPDRRPAAGTVDAAGFWRGDGSSGRGPARRGNPGAAPRRRGDIDDQAADRPGRNVAYQVRLVEAVDGSRRSDCTWLRIHPGRSEWAPVSNSRPGCHRAGRRLPARDLRARTARSPPVTSRFPVEEKVEVTLGE